MNDAKETNAFYLYWQRSKLFLYPFKLLPLLLTKNCIRIQWDAYSTISHLKTFYWEIKFLWFLMMFLLARIINLLSTEILPTFYLTHLLHYSNFVYSHRTINCDTCRLFFFSLSSLMCFPYLLTTYSTKNSVKYFLNSF